MTRFVTLPVIYGLLAALLLALGFGGWQWAKASGLRADLAESRAELATVKASIAEERVQFVTWARDQEQKHTAEMARIDREQQEKIARDQAANDRLVADLRADRVRLHSRWQAALATSRLSASVAAAGRADEGAGDVEESVGRIIGAARACDAQVIGLQQVVRAMQATCSGSPPK